MIARTFAWLASLAVLLTAGFFALRFFLPVVTVTRTVQGPVIRAVYATGTVSPEREYPIRATNAARIDRVFVDKGSFVTAGQALAQLAEPDLEFAAAQADAELAEKRARADERTSPVLADYDGRIAAAVAQLETAQRDEARQRSNADRGGGSQTDLDRSADHTQTILATLGQLRGERASKLLEVQREATVAASAAQMAHANLGRQTLASPISGAVLDRPLSEGTRVAVNDSVMRVADVRPEKLVMRAAVDEEDVTRVTVGQRVIITLYAFEGAHFDGTVKTIYPEADVNRRTFEVDVAIADPNPRLQSGMTGELAFVVEEKAVATILPSHAVQNDAIYAVRDGRIVKLDVRIGVRAVDRVEVLSGVGADERVIVSSVKPGSVGGRARTTEIDPRAAAGLDKPDAAAGGGTFKGFKG